MEGDIEDVSSERDNGGEVKACTSWIKRPGLYCYRRDPDIMNNPELTSKMFSPHEFVKSGQSAYRVPRILTREIYLIRGGLALETNTNSV
ncbi:hypothetical protein TNCV_955291 [Trichonephila clavipes]|nr:hypothetical protein TNCV_955291 [Trichonephila clavipes]